MGTHAMPEGVPVLKINSHLELNPLESSSVHIMIYKV